MDGVLPQTRLTHPDTGPLSGRGEHTSGAGSADGGHFGRVGGRSDIGGLRFDAPVSPGGYVWWYVDALSSDGRHGLTVIAFVGSVFSPYYALARRRGRGDPLNHCALNIALYEAGRKRWAMTERGSAQLSRTASTLAIGPSMMAWSGDVLTIQIDEVTAPLPTRLRGIVRVYPKALAKQAFDLDAAGRHRWQALAPCSHVEVLMSKPSLRWSGAGYVDTNSGDEPIEDAFESWNWSRADLRNGTAVLYDVTRRDGSKRSLSLLFNPIDQIETFDPPARVALPPTRWRIARETRTEDARAVRVVKTLESSPFYARTLISTRLLRQQALAIHESLSLDRFRSGLVQTMLPFRMPRALR
jgi:carotenoid 1,2-hydratase